MAFTKVNLTATVNTIKEAWTKFNNLIDDLLSVSSGKGASQIGIYDSAENMDAANVEDALAEIYTDHASVRTLVGAINEDADTTSGLVWGYESGLIRADNVVVSVLSGTIAITDDATNYIEIKTDGTITKNTTGFSVGRIPLREVVCAGGVQTTSTDKRTFLQAAPADVVIGTSLTIPNTGLHLLDTNASHDLIIKPGSDLTEDRTLTLITGDRDNKLSMDMMLSMFNRAKFTYNGGATAYTVKVGAANYYCKDKLAFWDSELTTAAIGGSPSGDTWVYLCLDYSAITSGTEITNTELVWSLSAPTWNETYKAWMNGDDRCIFAVKTNSGPTNINVFWHDGGGMVQYDAVDVIFNDTGPATWTTQTVGGMPAFSQKVQVTVRVDYAAAAGQVYIRTTGSSETYSKLVGAVDAASIISYNTIDIITNGSQQFDLDTSNTFNVVLYCLGWYFPIGM